MRRDSTIESSSVLLVKASVLPVAGSQVVATAQSLQTMALVRQTHLYRPSRTHPIVL